MVLWLLSFYQILLSFPFFFTFLFHRTHVTLKTSKDRYEKAVENGKKGGRKPEIDRNQVFELKAKGYTHQQIADELDCSKDAIKKILQKEGTKGTNLNDNLNVNENVYSNSTDNPINKECMTDNKEESGEKKLREIEDLSDEELESIITNFREKVKYKETQKRLNLRCEITKDTIKKVEDILAERKQDKKKNINLNVLNKFGLSQSEGDEISNYLLECSWSCQGEYIENNMKVYMDITGMSVKEMLCFFRDNELATHNVYSEYIPKSSWDNKRYYTYYEDYLKAFIKDKDELTEFAEDMMISKNVYSII